MSLFYSYKELRNRVRRLNYDEAMVAIWHYAQYIRKDRFLPPGTGVPDLKGRWVLPNDIHYWQIHLIAREVCLHATTAPGSRRLADWPTFATIHNKILDLCNEASVYRNDDDIYRTLHQIGHQQLANDDLNTSTLMRYMQLFSGPQLRGFVSGKLGMSPEEYFFLAFAVLAGFNVKPTLNIETNYEPFGITKEASYNHLRSMTIPAEDLRKQVTGEQSYDSGWEYTWNPLRQNPLVCTDLRFPNRVYCPISEFYAQRAVQGLYFDLLRQPGFGNAFGDEFERYIGRTLEKILGKPKVHRPEPYIVSSNNRHGNDWTVFDDSAAAFIECKTKRMTVKSKAALTDEHIDSDATKLAQAIVQNYKNILDVESGRAASPCTAHSKKFNVVVTLEDWVIFSPFSKERIVDSVAEQLNMSGLHPDITNRIPYLIFSSFELEVACFAMKKHGVFNVLNTKTEPTYRDWMMNTYLRTCYEDAYKAGKTMFHDDFNAFGLAAKSRYPGRNDSR